MKNLQISILGAGFSGLALCHYLQQMLDTPLITLWDPKGIGGGASGVATGMIHPYAGVKARLNVNGHEGFAETETLIALAENQLNRSIILSRGILRLPKSEEQQLHFEQAALEHEDLVWLKPKETVEKLDWLPHTPSLWIPNGLTIDCQAYLEGLWQSCKANGARLRKQAKQELGPEHTFIACGIACKDFLPDLPLTPIKGQTLLIDWPETLTFPTFTVSHSSYLTPTSHPRRFLLGGTYERTFSSPEPDPQTARSLLLEPYPLLKTAHVQSCQAAIRTSTPDHLPIAKQVDDKTFVFTGLGSKGLLWHAHYAKALVSSLSF
ncbi:MAG: FAD-binding oxidoreductase [Chlamydiia bacterium]|nr:FAD-binding oxidoreductase [Chlamydiia bacterium]